MAGRIRFVCVLHSHQPVGNFDKVIEEAYQMSYQPYTELFEQFPQIALSNHFSGCLLEWIEEHHPEFFDRLRRHCKPKRSGPGGPGIAKWEVIGGGLYEPIMTMLPSHDRIRQIARMAAYIENRIGARPRGFWLPERVWEPALVKDLADANVQYLTLDDNHFRAAGLEENELTGGFVAEDQGRIVQVYPAAEKLRYLIPYATVEECIQWLRSLLPAEGERVVCYADDGEKFGVWPKTYKHVYTDGWLRRFLEALAAAQSEGWLSCSTLGDAYDQVGPVGGVCLPENSYREMTEWVLPAKRLASYEKAVHGLKQDQALWNDWRIQNIMPLVKGGNWRAFKVKYAEANRLYAKMMEVSEKIDGLPAKDKRTEKARTHLFRGQCNCPYWHGVFGGLYLPHLRCAVYRELIRADKLADEAAEAPALSGVVKDFDFDGEPEVKLGNPHLALYLHPSRGGHLYEFDLRDLEFNVGDTFSRRYEAYHDKVACAVVGDAVPAASIHDLVLAKQSGLLELLQYDSYLRESLVDHLSSVALTPAHLLSGNPPSDPGFRQGGYNVDVTGLPKRQRRIKSAASEDRPRPGNVSVELSRRGTWSGAKLKVSKRIAVSDRAAYEVAYTVEHLEGPPVDGFFGVEMNYSLLAGVAFDRYYYHEKSQNAGNLSTAADFGVLGCVGLKDQWLHLALTLRASPPAQVLVSPVRTVSQSEGGFEAVYQSSSVVLQWPLQLAAGQSFKATLQQEAGSA
ncbi:MAG: alpha-amylase/4-alpha-glucanotransferase domain-containing protein [Planctomycetota bacterium]